MRRLIPALFVLLLASSQLLADGIINGGGGAPTGAAGGGLTGTYPNPTVATVPASAMPALTGDCTTSAGAVATTCGKINGSTVSNGSWTPTANNFSPTGSPTYAGVYVRVGHLVYVQVLTAGTGNISGTAGTSTFTGLPYNVANQASCSGMSNTGTGVQIASGGYATTTTWFVPTFGATAANAAVTFSCTYNTNDP